MKDIIISLLFVLLLTMAICIASRAHAEPQALGIWVPGSIYPQEGWIAKSPTDKHMVTADWHNPTNNQTLRGHYLIRANGTISRIGVSIPNVPGSYIQYPQPIEVTIAEKVLLERTFISFSQRMAFPCP